jgi:vacuolar-type H+-ATPase subunit H
MASKEVTSDIASLESKAETVLVEARAKAAELLRSASQEAARILAEPLALEGVKAECAGIVEAAREQSRRAEQDSTKEADRLRVRVKAEGATTFQTLVHKIEGMVRGAR